MQIFEEVATALNIDQGGLEKESLKAFLERKLRNVEVEIYRIAAKHGVHSVLELDDKLKRGEVTEEEMLDDFMDLEYLESRREEFVKAMKKIK